MKSAFTIEPLAALYPADGNHLEDVHALLPPAELLPGVAAAGAMIGCGAAKFIDTDILSGDAPYGEIKRVFVLAEHRGHGVSKAIMQEFEGQLLGRGIPLARLETGIRQPAAIGLYRRPGYLERPPFAGYQPDPLSIFMEKRLGA